MKLVYLYMADEDMDNWPEKIDWDAVVSQILTWTIVAGVNA